MFDTPVFNHSCRLKYMPDLDKADIDAIINDTSDLLTCGNIDPNSSWTFKDWVQTNGLSGHHLWPLYNDAESVTQKPAFELVWYAPCLRPEDCLDCRPTNRSDCYNRTQPTPAGIGVPSVGISWPVRAGPDIAAVWRPSLNGLPQMRCDSRGEYDEEYGGLCLRPCAQRFYADTNFWDPTDPSKTGWGTAVSSAGPTRNNSIPKYCACYHNPVTYNGTNSTSSFPWDLWKSFNQKEDDGTALYYHHDFWKPSTGSVTGNVHLDVVTVCASHLRMSIRQKLSWIALDGLQHLVQLAHVPSTPVLTLLAYSPTLKHLGAC